MFLTPSGPWFSISEFNIQAYCEVQLKYRWSGIVRVTPSMVLGTKAHKQIENKFVEDTKDLEEVSIEQALELAKQGISTVARELPITSPTFRLNGIIDQIEITPNGIIILDDKPSEYAHYGSQVQLYLYAIAFKDRYRPDLDIQVRIRHRDSGDTVWEDMLTEEIHNEIMERLQRMVELALGQREFEPTQNPKKCEKCTYREMCKTNL
ncbi:MAG: PD-(D/E)XK nuclease family protein [Candidatus Aenigmarchaeota archaeon]|nr:PD-(D/E)XK nuclease family protein [Candidatus Aenigmarchaeota archaeon]